MSLLENIEAYENGKELAAAVVVQAFKDYKKYKIKLFDLEEEAKSNQKKLKNLRTKITQIETFLGEYVPDMNYQAILDNLLSEAKSEYEEKNAKKRVAKNKRNNKNKNKKAHSEVI